jgi:hypothetical protein
VVAGATAAILFVGFGWHLANDLMTDIVVFMPAGRPPAVSHWVEHLRQAGFSVLIEEDVSSSGMRRFMHVPDQFSAGPTALILKPVRYALSGTVPADVIVQLLTERPKIGGIALTDNSAPRLSPDDAPASSYDVWAFSTDGSEAAIYLHREPAQIL